MDTFRDRYNKIHSVMFILCIIVAIVFTGAIWSELTEGFREQGFFALLFWLLNVVSLTLYFGIMSLFTKLMCSALSFGLTILVSIVVEPFLWIMSSVKWIIQVVQHFRRMWQTKKRSKSQSNYEYKQRTEYRNDYEDWQKTKSRNNYEDRQKSESRSNQENWQRSESQNDYKQRYRSESQYRYEHHSFGEQDAFSLYGLSRPFTKEQLRKKMKQLNIKYHPDNGGSEETCKNVNLAYNMLLKYAIEK